MIFKASVLALIAPLACATIVLQTPEGIRSSSSYTFTWSTSDPADPTYFSLELTNDIFHKSYAIANDVPTSQGTVTITIPDVPAGDGYALEAVNIGNITDIYSSTSAFSVGAPLSSSTSGTGTSTGTIAGTSKTSLAGTSTSTGFGSTVGTSTSTSISTPGTSSSGTQTSSTSTGSATAFNNGAQRGSGSRTAVALSALAGVAFLAL